MQSLLRVHSRTRKRRIASCSESTKSRRIERARATVQRQDASVIIMSHWRQLIKTVAGYQRKINNAPIAEPDDGRKAGGRGGRSTSVHCSAHGYKCWQPYFATPPIQYNENLLRASVLPIGHPLLRLAFDVMSKSFVGGDNVPAGLPCRFKDAATAWNAILLQSTLLQFYEN